MTCGTTYLRSILKSSCPFHDSALLVIKKHTSPLGLCESIFELAAHILVNQVYVDGEFIGGADIMEELSTSGQLKATLMGGGA